MERGLLCVFSVLALSVSCLADCPDPQHYTPLSEQQKQRVEKNMNKLVVYEHNDFRGLSREFTCDHPNLQEVSFAKAISSLKVFGQPWKACSQPSYTGVYRVYEEGLYTNLGNFGKQTSSLEMIQAELWNPRITLFNATNFGGIARTYSQETDLSMGNMDNQAYSHKVSRGVWLLYDRPGCDGYKLLTWRKELLRDYSTMGFNSSISYLRPLRAVESVVMGVRVLWEQGSVSKSKQSAGEITSENPSPIAQTLTVVQSITREVSVTQSISFSASSSLTLGTSFSLVSTLSDGPLTNSFGLELRLDLQLGFRVQKGRIESKTSTFKRQLTLPTVIPAHSKVTVRIMRETSSFTFPVEMQVWRGSSTCTETAELSLTDTTGVNIQYQSQQLN